MTTHHTQTLFESHDADPTWWSELLHSALAAIGLVAGVLLINFLLLLPVAQAQGKGELRIGLQKSASLFVLQRAQGTLEKRLAPLGVSLKWLEFPAGPQLLEGLNVGSVDVGFVGEAPPIFAQAEGARFVYIGNDPAAPEAEAVVVSKGSPIKSVAELKGKKIALNKGSNVHYLLVKLLGDATLSAPGMPKSGFMANNHAKVAADAVIALIKGEAVNPQPIIANTCYSFVSDEDVVHVASVHNWNADQKTLVAVQGAGGLSAQANALEGQYARSWARNIWADALL